MVEGKQIKSTRGAVAAYPPEAARIGAQILEAGGNAMDAIAATCIAGCILDPASAGIAGYMGSGVVLVADNNGGRVLSIDSNSVLPAEAHESMFQILPLDEDTTAVLQGTDIDLDPYFCRVRDDANQIGPLAVGVPGTMGCIGTIWETWGRLKWSQIVNPSIELLENGLQLAGPDGVKHRPEMLRTLVRLSKTGWRDIYIGDLGEKIADSVQAAGGILKREDMAAFEPRITEPYAITYRNSTVHCPILPNGALTTLQALNMLDCLSPQSDDCVQYWHLVAEVLKLAWRDRLRYLADPEFVSVPVDRLLSKEYAFGRIESIRQFPRYVDKRVPWYSEDRRHGTFHFSSADSDGNVASVTLTHGSAFGSKFIVPGTGIVLGHPMSLFDPRPGYANSIAGGKRPLNNTCPVLARLPDRDIAVGLPGGRYLLSANAQIIQRIIDFGATGYEAAVSPRLHVSSQEPLYLTENATPSIFRGLSEMGHEVKKSIMPEPSLEGSVRQVAGRAHIAEFLKTESMVRAGGNGWAAGVDLEMNQIS